MMITAVLQYSRGYGASPPTRLSTTKPHEQNSTTLSRGGGGATPTRTKIGGAWSIRQDENRPTSALTIPQTAAALILMQLLQLLGTISIEANANPATCIFSRISRGFVNEQMSDLRHGPSRSPMGQHRDRVASNDLVWGQRGRPSVGVSTTASSGVLVVWFHAKWHTRRGRKHSFQLSFVCTGFPLNISRCTPRSSSPTKDALSAKPSLLGPTESPREFLGCIPRQLLISEFDPVQETLDVPRNVCLEPPMDRISPVFLPPAESSGMGGVSVITTPSVHYTRGPCGWGVTRVDTLRGGERIRHPRRKWLSISSTLSSAGTCGQMEADAETLLDHDIPPSDLRRLLRNGKEPGATLSAPCNAGKHSERGQVACSLPCVLIVRTPGWPRRGPSAGTTSQRDCYRPPESTAQNASWVSSTFPTVLARFFPFFCFSNSFFFRVASPPPTVFPDFVSTSFLRVPDKVAK